MTVCLYAATKSQFDDTVAIHPTSAEGMCHSARVRLGLSVLTVVSFRTGHIKVDEALGGASENVN